jgi:hypothetical protein
MRGRGEHGCKRVVWGVVGEVVDEPVELVVVVLKLDVQY